jgi:oligo-1,6-glucosidase
MVFQFEHVGLDQGDSKWDVRPLDLRDLKASLGRWQAGLAETGWNSLYWNNHDQPRAVSRFGDDRPEHRVRSAKLLGTVLHLHRGTPYVYQGEELGLTNAGFGGIEDYHDIESLNHYAAAIAAGESPEVVLAGLRAMSRDNARTPMPWDDAAAAVADPDSVFHHYRRLIQLRHDEPAVALGEFTLLLPDHEQVYAFTRTLDSVKLLVLANFSAGDVTFDLPDATDWAGPETVLSNYPDSAAPLPSTTLRPWEAVVFRTGSSA